MSAHGSAPASGGRYPEALHDDHGVVINNGWAFRGLNTTVAQWIWYTIASLYTITWGIVYYVVQPEAWWAYLIFIFLGMAPAIAWFPTVTYAILHRINITPPHPLPTTPPPTEHEKEEYQRALHQVEVNKGARRSLMSQFRWAWMVLGITVAVSATVIAVAPRSLLTNNHPLHLMASALLIAGVMAFLRVEKYGWVLIPTGFLIAAVIGIGHNTDWSEWFGGNPNTLAGLEWRVQRTDDESVWKPKLQYELGLAYERERRIEDAAKAYEKVIEWYQDNPGRYNDEKILAGYNLAGVYETLGETAKAAEFAAWARDQAPRSLQSQKWMGQTWAHWLETRATRLADLT